ncbi:hypothetical protein RINTHH_21670 [Richelia intracellularis HH01]|uniref:Uncharacterized protein n=1 Tax=Richelia intracellularis HH01 TaxID=1165094 RepID=M1X0J6_9NOST|nr:hypothetical protein RINTHH_21670 [Richelia intracellularis HH01]
MYWVDAENAINPLPDLNAAIGMGKNNDYFKYFPKRNCNYD